MQHLFTVLLAVLSLDSFLADNFHPDCADPHNKNVSCSVHVVSCDESHVAVVGNDALVPPEAHDVRVEAFARAQARDKADHQLHVDISWQLPPNNESFLMRAFELEVEGDGIRSCFLFNVSNFGWTTDAASPRFHFSSDSLFEFSENYSIWLRSLPRSRSKRPQVFKNQTMPKSPDHDVDDKSNITSWCKTHSDPQASKWTAAFRRIFLHSLARTIQIEFVGAPAHYCFEAYEVRLMDESGLELLHSQVVESKDMKSEIINGKAVLFGEFNFTNLQMETDYIPSVIPVERSSDGRCLCPIQGESGDPYDSHIVCSCIAADWKKVRLHRVDKLPAPPCTECIQPNVTHTIDSSTMSQNHKSWYLLLFILFLLVLLGVLLYFLIAFLQKQRRRGKALTLRFSPAQGAVTSEPRAPLIYNSSTSVLIIYAHDCVLHDECVQAFAHLLRDTFGLQVHFDKWDVAEIEQNLAEYINGSIVRADKIIIVNSIGASLRVTSRHKKLLPLETMNPGPFDSIFESQIDLALQHARVISVRFPYTPSNYTLYALSPLLQYTIPDNIGLLVSTLTECPMKSDPRLVGFDPALSRLHAAVSRMTHFCDSDPQWFQRTHHRIPSPRFATAVPLSLPVVTSAGDSVDSGIGESTRHGTVVVATSPMDNEAAPLLESCASETLRDASRENVVHEIVPEEPSSSGVPPDSAYLSGCISSILPRSEDNRSDASGSDRPEDPIINNSPVTPENEELEDTLPEEESIQRPNKDKVPGAGLNQNGDSGMISDYHSGLIS